MNNKYIYVAAIIFLITAFNLTMIEVIKGHLGLSVFSKLEMSLNEGLWI